MVDTIAVVFHYRRPQGFDQIISAIDYIQGQTRRFCSEHCYKKDEYNNPSEWADTGAMGCPGCPIESARRHCYLTMYGVIDLKKIDGSSFGQTDEKEGKP